MKVGCPTSPGGRQRPTETAQRVWAPPAGGRSSPDRAEDRAMGRTSRATWKVPSDGKRALSPNCEWGCAPHTPHAPSGLASASRCDQVSGRFATHADASPQATLYWVTFPPSGSEFLKSLAGRSSRDAGIEPPELDPCVLRREAPPNGRAATSAEPGGGERAQLLERTDALVETLSSFGGREGLPCFLRLSARSSPSSTERRRTRSTVARPTSSSSAISSSVSPSSAFSKIRARCASSRDARARERISSSAVRSSSARFTMYRFIALPWIHGSRPMERRLSGSVKHLEPLDWQVDSPIGSEWAADEVERRVIEVPEGREDPASPMDPGYWSVFR